MGSKHIKISLLFFMGLLLICLIDGQSTSPQTLTSQILSALGQFGSMFSQMITTFATAQSSSAAVQLNPYFQISPYMLNAMIQYLNSTQNCSNLVGTLSPFLDYSAPYNNQSLTSASNTIIGGLSTMYQLNVTGFNMTYMSALASCLSGIGGSNQPGPSNGLPMGPPQRPPRPPSAPVNAFANVDPRIAFLLSAAMPSLSSSAVAAIASNRTVWAPIFDAIPTSQILSGCNYAMQMYQYMEDQIVLFNDSNNYVTYARLFRMIVCKNDCNFGRLLSVPSNFSANVTAFYSSVVNYLPSKAATKCMNQNPAMASAMSNLSPGQLAANPAYVSFMKPSQLGAMSSADSLTVAQALSTSGNSLSPAMAKSLGQNIPPNTPLNSIAGIASSVPLSCFNNTSPGQLANLIGSMDLSNMDPMKKGFIASKVAASNNATVIATLLASTTDSSIINAIPAAQFASLGINPFSIPATNLPKSYQKSLAASYLANNSLASLTDPSVLARILPGINPSTIRAMQTQNPSAVPATLTNIANASAINSVSLTSAQRAAMLSTLVNSLASTTNTTNASVYLYQLTPSQLSVLYPLFIEANSTILAGFSTIFTFAYVISYVSDLSASQCCAYARSGRALFATYAAAYSFTYYNLALDDLYALGPCLVSVLPDTYVQNINPSTFVSYFSTLGNVYQPKASQQTIAQSLISSYVSNSSVMASTSQATVAFSTLGSLALYYPFSTYSNSISTWSANGGSLMSTMTTAYSSSISANQLCQVGLSSTDTAGYTSLLNSYGSTFVSQYISAVSSATTTVASGRKKRQSSSYTFTCSDLTTMDSGISSLTTTQLATISTSQFYSCQSTIGSLTTWSSSQLSTLASTALSYYGSASSISDGNITILNYVMTGFSSTSLSSLTFTTTTSISTLGSLTGWSSAQLTALATPLTTYITTYLSGSVTSDFMTSAGNLLCSLSSNQISSVSTNVFASSISSLSKISLACPNIANWYALAKTVPAYGSSLYSSSSSISELGSVMSGITTTDLASVSADQISSFSTLSFQYMPAATVNSMSTTQLAGLAHDQVTSLLNSPYYSSFSSAITSYLATASGGTATTSGASQISLNYLAKLSIGFYFILLSIFYSC